MSQHKLRFDIFGAGDFAPHFAPYINEVAEPVAVFDPSPAARTRFRQKTGLLLREFDDPTRLLEAVDVDAVAILSPNHTHKPITIAAARAGKHVYCEKAMAPTVPDCWEMVRACEAANVRLMVGHKRRLRSPWARMIQLRDELGPVYSITSCVYYDARPYNFSRWWTRAAESGGNLHVSDVHFTDWMRAMCGDVATVRAQAAPRIDKRYDYPDTIHVELKFQSGALATLNASLSYPLLKYRESGGPLVICRDGGMRFVPFMDHIDLYWQHERDSGPRQERFDDLGFDHAFRKEIGDFVRWITEGTEPSLTWAEGLRCVEVMEAAHRSAKEDGTPIRLPLYPELERA